MLFFVTTVYVGCFSPFLDVSVRVVNASGDVSTETIGQFFDERLSGSYGGIVPRRNYFFIRSRKLESLLEQEYPVLRDVTVSKIFPDTLEVSVRERAPIVLWCSAGPCVLLDESGRALDSDRIYTLGYDAHALVIVDQSGKPVSVGELVIDPERREKLIALWEGCRRRGDGVLVRTLVLSTRLADEVRGSTAEGWEIYFSTERPADASLKALDLVLKQELSDDKRHSLAYVDLRVENRIYYALQDGKEDEVTEEKDGNVENTSSPEHSDTDGKEKKKKK